MTFSDLKSRDDGREIFFEARDEVGTYRFVLSAEMLDDECGDEASEQDRVSWVQEHMAGILSTLTARRGGGFVTAPYGRVLVEEIT